MSTQPPSPILRIGIVEDDPATRELLRRVIAKSAGLCCVGAFATGEEAVRGLPPLLPDMVLMDVHLPGMSGIECTRQIRRIQPSVKVVMVTGDQSNECLFAALNAGADGYVTKPCDRTMLTRVIAEAMAGGRPISSDMTMHLVHAAVKQKPVSPRHPGLSERENEVMKWLAHGMENKEIAKRIQVSVFTVNAHLQSIYGKLNVNNRTEAIRRVEAADADGME